MSIFHPIPVFLCLRAVTGIAASWSVPPISGPATTTEV